MGTAGSYCVYILASRRHGTLYIGITRDVSTRLVATAVVRSS